MFSKNYYRVFKTSVMIVYTVLLLLLISDYIVADTPEYFADFTCDDTLTSNVIETCTSSVTVPLPVVRDDNLGAVPFTQTVEDLTYISSDGYFCNGVFYENTTMIPTDKPLDGDNMFCNLVECVDTEGLSHNAFRYCTSGQTQLINAYGNEVLASTVEPTVEEVKISSEFYPGDHERLPLPVISGPTRRTDGVTDPSSIDDLVCLTWYLDDSGKTIKITFSNPTHTISDLYWTSNTVVARIQKLDYNKPFVLTAEQTVIEMDAKFLSSKGLLTVSVRVGNEDCGSISQNYYGRQVCLMYDCTWCSARFNNFSCLSNSDKTLFLLLTISILLVIICCIPAGGWKIVEFIFALLWYITAILLYIPKWIISKIRGIDISNPPSPTDKKTDIEKNFVNPRKTKTSGWKNWFLISMFMPTAQGCVTGMVIPTVINSCVDNGTYTFCQPSFEALVELPFTGSSTCLTLEDGTTSVSSLELFYDAFGMTPVKGQCYYTCGSIPSCNSRAACYSSAVCSKDNCINYPAQTDPCKYNAFSSDCLFPAATFCRRSSQCTSENHNRCVFSYCTPKPTGAIYRVCEILGYTVNIITRLAYIDSLGTTMLQYVLTKIATIQQPFQARLVGSFDKNEPKLGTMKLINKVGDESQYYLQHASDYNRPVKGMIGDIQAPTVDKLLNKQFIWDKAMVQRNQLSNSDTFVWTQPGINRLNDATTLTVPGVVHGDHWYYNETYGLYMIPGDSPSVVVHLQSTVNYTVARLTTAVCPTDVTIIHAEGCYTCVGGFKITIEMRSSMAPGPVSVESETLLINNPVHEITSGLKNYFIYGLSETEDNTGTISIVGSDCTATVDYSFTLDLIIDPPDTENYTVSVNGKKEHKSTGSQTKDFFTNDLPDGLKDAFSFTGAWWKSFLMYAAIALFLVFVIGKILMRAQSGDYGSYVKAKTKYVHDKASPLLLKNHRSKNYRKMAYLS